MFLGGKNLIVRLNYAKHIKIDFILIVKNLIENNKFHLLVKLCKIQENFNNKNIQNNMRFNIIKKKRSGHTLIECKASDT